MSRVFFKGGQSETRTAVTATLDALFGTLANDGHEFAIVVKSCSHGDDQLKNLSAQQLQAQCSSGSSHVVTPDKDFLKWHQLPRQLEDKGVTHNLSVMVLGQRLGEPFKSVEGKFSACGHWRAFGAGAVALDIDLRPDATDAQREEWRTSADHVRRRYMEQLDALAAQGDIPAPTVIAASHGGLVAVWRCDKSLVFDKVEPHEKYPRGEAFETWYQVSLGLAQHLNQNIDSPLCADESMVKSGRAVRLPGSVHRKSVTQTPYLVKLLRHNEKAVASWSAFDAVRSTRPAPVSADPLNMSALTALSAEAAGVTFNPDIAVPDWPKSVRDLFNKKRSGVKKSKPGALEQKALDFLCDEESDAVVNTDGSQHLSAPSVKLGDVVYGLIAAGISREDVIRSAMYLEQQRCIADEKAVADKRVADWKPATPEEEARIRESCTSEPHAVRGMGGKGLARAVAVYKHAEKRVADEVAARVGPSSIDSVEGYKALVRVLRPDLVDLLEDVTDLDAARAIVKPTALLPGDGKRFDATALGSAMARSELGRDLLWISTPGADGSPDKESWYLRGLDTPYAFSPTSRAMDSVVHTVVVSGIHQLVPMLPADPVKLLPATRNLSVPPQNAPMALAWDNWVTGKQEHGLSKQAAVSVRRELVRSADEANALAHILPVKNGWVDVDVSSPRCGHLFTQLNPAPLFTRFVRHPYIEGFHTTPEAQELMQFLYTSVGQVDCTDEERWQLINVLLELESQALVGEAGRFLIWLYGPKASGKSRYTDNTTATLGNSRGRSALAKHFAVAPGVAMLKKSKGYENAEGATPLARLLQECRFSFFGDFPDEELDGGVVKQLTGDDVTTARALRQDNEQGAWIATPIVTSNFLPRVDLADDATRSRIVVVPFNRRAELNDDLVKVLREDNACRAKLSLLVEARKRLSRMTPAQRANPYGRSVALERFRREVMLTTDPVETFLSTQCQLDCDLNDATVYSQLRDSFERWVENSDVEYPMDYKSKGYFTKRLEALGYKKKQRKRDGGRYFIRLSDTGVKVSIRLLGNNERSI